MFYFGLKTFKASLYSSEKHFLFDNVLLMNRRLALKVFKIVKETSVSCIINFKAYLVLRTRCFQIDNAFHIGL